MTRTNIALTSSLLLALVLGSAATATDDEATAEHGLAEALTYVEPTTRNVGFTDWTAIKASHGVEALTSAIPEGFRIGTLLEVSRDEAFFAGFGLQHIVGHAETWGWDSTDLAWEAALFGDAGPVSVLRFREDLDLGPFIDRLDEREFDERIGERAIIRTHAMDSEPWLPTTDLGILNIAILPDGRTLVMASDPERLELALAATGDERGAGLIDTLTKGDGVIHSAFIEFGLETCTNYDPRAEQEPHPGNAAVLTEALPLRPWQTLVLATGRDAGDDPVARLLLSFPNTDADALKSEGDGRGALARDGLSERNGQPLAEVAFTVDDVSTGAGTVALDLRPVDGRLRNLQQAVFSRDLLPAMCGA